MPLTEEEKKELDDIARKMPNWQEHLADFRKRHPELSPQDVMRKAGFTFRMKKGKLMAGWIKRMFKRVADEVMSEQDEGVKAIIFLQGLAGIEEPEERATRNWNNFTDREKEQTLAAYRQLNK